LLTFIVFFPLLGAIAVATLPREEEWRAKQVAALVTTATLAASVIVLTLFERDEAGFQFVERFRWIEAGGFDIQYFLGIDGINLVMVMLTTLLFVLAMLISWNIELRPREYFAWLLVLETGVLGVFTSLDLILFFLFWEVELLPMYMLISIWGTGRKEYSATKFVIYTLAGSALMLTGILVLGFSADPHTFDIRELSQAEIRDVLLPLPAIFFLIFAGFAVKLPVFPFHTWLPDAHSDAPTAVSVILAGVLLKMGGYGMIRVCVTILPGVAKDYAVWLAAFAAVNIIYGAIVTLRQTDLKRLIAYSSVSHMGYVLLGIAAMGQVGLTGATLQMFTHGTITGLLFVMVGLVYNRTHTRDIAQLKGLAHNMPVIATVMLIAGLASLGLPAMSGFVAEVMVFLGTIDKHPAATIIAVTGIVLTAGYVLWMIERVFFGPAVERWRDLDDATEWWEQIPMAALVATILVVGVYPAILVDIITNGVEPIVARLV